MMNGFFGQAPGLIIDNGDLSMAGVSDEGIDQPIRNRE